MRPCAGAIVLSCLAFAQPAPGQLAPVGACAHIKAPIHATLTQPDAPSSSGAPAVPGVLGLELIVAESGQVLESRPAKAGAVDLAEVFPRLWTTDKPQVLYAQAVLGTRRIGAPMVLVPMVPPRYAPRVDRDGVPQLNPLPAGGQGKRAFSGYWMYVEQRVSVLTSKGEVVFALRPDAAPNSVAHFRDLVSKGFYDGVKVHRITTISGRTQPDIAQFGDPSGTGLGGSGSFIDYEPSPLKHGLGTLSFARLPSEPNSAGSQVIVCLGGGKDAATHLDGKYTVFGQMVSGAETLAAIGKAPADANGTPRGEGVTIESVRLIDAPPYEGPPKAAAEAEKKFLER